MDTPERNDRHRAIGRTALLLLALVLPGATMAEPVRLTSDEYAPLVSRHIEGSGLLSEIVMQTLEHAGIESELVFQPWRRGQAEVLAGRSWATYPYVKTAERKREYRFSRRPLFDNRIAFFYRVDRFPDSIEWSGLSDLRSWTIGAIRGYWYERDLEQAQLTVAYATDVESALRMLRLGRTDLLVLSELVGWYAIRQAFPGEHRRFATLERPYDVVPSWLMVSSAYPGSDRLLEGFDRAFQELERTGRFDALTEEYLPRQ